MSLVVSLLEIEELGKGTLRLYGMLVGGTGCYRPIVMANTIGELTWQLSYSNGNS